MAKEVESDGAGVLCPSVPGIPRRTQMGADEVAGGAGSPVGSIVT